MLEISERTLRSRAFFEDDHLAYELFERPTGGRICLKSTLPFSVSVQYLTDGFLCTDGEARKWTTSNHETALYPLHEQTLEQTIALRRRGETPAEKAVSGGRG